MKLDDFLKCKKVRCVSIGNYNYNFITVGKEYVVLGVDMDSVIIVSDADCEDSYPYKHFEPVLDSAENPLQKMELTPKFKVGDKVYLLPDTRILYVNAVFGEMLTLEDAEGEIVCGVDIPNAVCHATQENYERLQATFPDINFEAPPKELKGSDLARAMLDKGWKYVPCYVSNYGESEAQKPCIVRKFSSSGQFVSDFEFYNHAVPFDPKTGEHLTQAVLDE